METASKRLATEEGLKAIADAIKNTETVQMAKAEIQAEGETQVANVQAAAQEITGKVEQIQQNTDDVAELKSDLTNAENALTLVKSRNYFDKSKSEIISVQGTSVLASPKVSVNAGDKYYLSHHRNDSSGLLAEPFWGILGYDSSDSETLLGNWLQGYSIPSGIVSVRFLEASTNYTYIMVEKDTQTKVWEDFFEPYYKCVDDEARENISAISESIEDKTEFVVPSAFYGVVGHETNIYYQNIAKNMSIDSVCGFDTTGLSNVERYRDRLIWKPTSSGTNNGKISFYKNDWNHETKNITVSFKSAPANTGNTEIKVIVIGDSKIAYGEVVRYLDSLFADDNHTITLLGSRYDNQDTGDIKYKHEGRSGWSSYHYAYVNTYNGATNAFYNADFTDSQYGTKFDFTNYMSNQGYTSVDYVFINLGTNDYGQGIADIKWQTDAMIKSIHAFDSNIKIVVGLNEGVYRKDLQHKALNEWIYDLNATKIAKYDGKLSNVYVLPLYPSIDLYNDYSMTSVELSEGDNVVANGKTRNKVSDPIHQNRAGFYKYAMCMYSLIKCIESDLVS